MTKRILSTVLAVILCVSMVPSAWAAETADTVSTAAESDSNTTESITNPKFLISLRKPNGATLPDKITYTGEDQKPTVSIQRMGIYLVEGEDKDYTVDIVGDTKDVGTFTVTITGKGNYSGEVVKNIEITPCDISKEWVMVPSVSYNGEIQEPTVDFPFSSLQKGVDYTVTWSENADLTNAGDIPVTIAGKGPNCYGTVNDTFTISPANIRRAEVTNIKLGDNPTAMATLNGIVLTQNKDYTFAYNGEDNTFIITGKDNYSGGFSGYCAAKKNILFSAYPLHFTYNGQEQNPTIALTKDGEAVSDYTVAFGTDTVNAGEKDITVTYGDSNFAAKYTIAPYTLHDYHLEIAPTNNTEDAEQRPIINPNSYVPGNPKEGTGYTVTIPDGALTSDSYAITVTGRGNYTGEIKISYEKKTGSASVSIDGWNYGEAANEPD